MTIIITSIISSSMMIVMKFHDQYHNISIQITNAQFVQNRKRDTNAHRW